MKYILAIDPGNEKSAYVLMDYVTLEPLEAEIHDNRDLLCMITERYFPDTEVVIEMVASYGMAVGETVFETVFWIGRFYEAAGRFPGRHRIKRMDVKMNLCHSSRAKDSNVRQALVDRFAQHDKKNGKGTKKNPDWFYGFSADMWQAYAVGVTWSDTKGERT